MTDSLQMVAREVRRCRLCPLWRTRKQTVPGEGPESTKCMLIGESPGREEDLAGRPFVGRSGKFLDKALEAAGLSRHSFFITGSVKCHPPGNRDPKREELLSCRPYLERQIAIIRPEVIVLLGRIAANGFLGEVKLDEIRGKIIRRAEYRLLPTYHPSAAMRFPARRKPFLDDMKSLSLLGS